jgi:hypothetical protein
MQGELLPTIVNCSQRNVNNHPLTEEIQTPELLRSEAEQLVEQELITSSK